MAVNFLQVEKDLKIKRLFLCFWSRYSKVLPMFSKRVTIALTRQGG